MGLRKYKVAKSWGLSKSQERGREMRMGIMGYNQGKSPTTPSRLLLPPTKRLLLTQNLTALEIES